jgi:hypothetical protein
VKKAYGKREKEEEGENVELPTSNVEWRTNGLPPAPCPLLPAAPP